MKLKNLSLFLAGGVLMAGATRASAQTFAFTPGDLVVSTVSDQINPGTATAADLDTASPITLEQFSLGVGGTSVTATGSLELPTTTIGSNSAISGEYGSASEGILQDSVNGAYLTIMGYGVNYNTFNTDGQSLATDPYGTAALGQTTSLVGGTDTTVSRVVALIGANGSVNTSTALTGVFNENNPRSVATVDGTSFYVSGQGASETDGTGGVFYAPLGATTATPIAAGNETRTVSIVNNGSGNTLYVSSDVKGAGNGDNNDSNVSTLKTSSGALPTSSTGVTETNIAPGTTPSVNGGNTASIDLPSTPNNLLDNGVNDNTIGDSKGTNRNGKFVYLSPEQYFFASSTVMYVADSGQPKNGNADAAAEGEGGLQKWVFAAGSWTLQYDLSAGLNLVNGDGDSSETPVTPGVTGLFGLTGQVESNGTVELFATNYGLNELSPSYLYEITDSLNATAPTEGESFTTLESASAGTLFRGVAFSPEAVPEPSTTSLMVLMLLGGGAFAWKRKKTLT
jgi:hypothetical protein